MESGFKEGIQSYSYLKDLEKNTGHSRIRRVVSPMACIPPAVVFRLTLKTSSVVSEEPKKVTTLQICLKPEYG